MRDRRREPAHGAAPPEPGQHRLTLALWWIVLYLTVIYVAIRLGAHPALSDVG